MTATASIALRATDPRSQIEHRSVTLQFDDNVLLPLLYGEHDRHLARIEQVLGVRLNSRGNRIAISGGAERTALAEAALLALWKRLERGQHVGSAEVEAALRLAEGGAEMGEPRLPLADLPRHPHAQGCHRAALARPGRLYRDAGASRDGVRHRPRRHRQDLPRGGAGRRAAADRAGSTASCCRARRSRPASAWASCPATCKEKVDPYLRPLYDALHDMLPAEQVARRIASGEIEIAPLAFMRGRTLAHRFVILDEAQNTTPAQMKMFLTRMGESSRMVITGDPTQVDLPSGQPSGLAEALRILEGVDGIGVARFAERDVVRHPLVARIVAAYGVADDQKRAKKERDGTGK